MKTCSVSKHILDPLLLGLIRGCSQVKIGRVVLSAMLIDKLTLEKSLISVQSVARAFVRLLILEYIRESIRGGGLISVFFVEILLDTYVVLKYTRGSILKKSHINVLHVGRVSGLTQNSTLTDEFILEKIFIGVQSVARALVRLLNLKYT